MKEKGQPTARQPRGKRRSAVMDGGTAHLSTDKQKIVYHPPPAFNEIWLDKAMSFRERTSPAAARNVPDLFQLPAPEDKKSRSVLLFYAGDLTLLQRPCVAIVGTREVSDEGVRRTRKLAAMLVREQVVVVSGLAMGVDSAAHSAAVDANGKTIAVIGTPLSRCSPLRNAPLQEQIYRDHLLISQFEWGSTVYPTNFPKRNRTMAALCDATVIVEASDTSGTLHQALECVSLARPLFILRSLVEDGRVTWPARFLRHPTVQVLDDFDLLLRTVNSPGNGN
jgi:DNA processing protein